MTQLDASTELLGQLVDNRYRVLSILGAGGMGCVFEVEHVLVGKRLALKALNAELAQDKEILARFFREARAAAAVETEHVADVHDMGRLPDGSPYIVMELLRGKDLGKLIEQQAPLSVARAVRIARHLRIAPDPSTSWQRPTELTPAAG